MEYNKRKICGLINLHSLTNDLRCPQLFSDKSDKGTSCDGCSLFEEYLRFTKLSIELKEFEENEDEKIN